MREQIKVTAKTSLPLKPLIEGVIHSELKRLQERIERTREQLADFEKRFGMPSEDFERRFNAGEIEETLDTIDWLMEIETLRLLEKDYRILSEAEVGEAEIVTPS